MYRVIFMIYFLFSLLLFADGSSISREDNNIQALVNKVKAAKPSEKRILMNKLKLRLRQSNQAHRIQIMQELKHSFAQGTPLHQGLGKRKHKHRFSQSGKNQPKHKRSGQGKGAKRGGGCKH